MDAVHVCTPNLMHFPIAKAALQAGKHVICEKPLATSVEEAQELVELPPRRSCATATFHNLRYYPMVQHMRRMREDGDLGDIMVVQGTYSQDWLLYDTDWNWRLDSQAQRPVALHGRHRLALVRYGGARHRAAHHVGLRRSADVSQDAQAAERAGRDVRRQDAEARGLIETPIDTEDFGAVVFRMGDRTRGAFTASQVSAGRKNRLNIEIYGTKCGVSWDQERPDELWIGHRNSSNQIIIKDPSLLKEGAGPMPTCRAATAKATTTRSSRCSAASTNRSTILPPSPSIPSSWMDCGSSRFSKRRCRAIKTAPG